MFNLERLEKSIIIFLIITLLLGLAILVYKKTHSAVDVKVTNFEPGSLKEMDAIIDGAKTIDINEAGIEGLMRIKGIGRTLAERIIDYRSKNGPFESPSEIKNVKGIGNKLFEDIKDRISIE